MAEQQISGTEEKKFSRREFALFGAVAVAQVLTEGAAFNRRPTRELDNSKNIDAIELISSNVFGEEGGTLSTSRGKLLYDPYDNFFTPESKFSYIHRANRIVAIDEAYSEGANLFDIDINNVDGVLYGEHGLVPRVNMHLGRRDLSFWLPLVVDVNELALKIGRPKHKYEELVEYIASKSGSDNILSVSAELKRGRFNESTIREIIDIHHKYKVPVMMHSGQWSHLWMDSSIAFHD